MLAVPPVFVVADGVGGSEAGEVASAIVIEEFDRLLASESRAAGSAVTHASTVIDPDRVPDALAAAQRRVLALHGPGPQGAGSTAVGAVGVMSGGEPYWVIFNVGDSRIYRLLPADGERAALPNGRSVSADTLTSRPIDETAGQARLCQVSVDHSHSQELLEAGLITAEEAPQHPGNNLVTRAVGSPDGFEPDYWMLPMVPGDRLLLCSDGLTSEVATETMTEVMSAGQSPTDTAAELLRLTLAAGARDNVSAIVVDVLDHDRVNACDG